MGFRGCGSRGLPNNPTSLAIFLYLSLEMWPALDVNISEEKGNILLPPPQKRAAVPPRRFSSQLGLRSFLHHCRPVLYIQVPTAHCHRLLPINGPHRVVKRLCEEGSRVERQPKEDAGSTPPSRSKKSNMGFFVTNHLYPTGAGIGLVGELFGLALNMFNIVLFFLPATLRILSAFQPVGLANTHLRG